MRENIVGVIVLAICGAIIGLVAVKVSGMETGEQKSIRRCVERWKDSGRRARMMDDQWVCLVEVRPGVWIPETAVREVP